LGCSASGTTLFTSNVAIQVARFEIIYAVSQIVGYIKGKSAIHIARTFGERKRNCVGRHFRARGFFVSTR